MTLAPAAPAPAGRTDSPDERSLVVSFEDFANEQIATADSLWGDALLVRGGGYLVLGGEGGVGKTLLFANLAIKLAAGEKDFLGFELPGRKVHVLLLQAEGARSRVRDRLVQTAMSLGHGPSELPLFFHRKAVELSLEETLKPMIEQSAAELVILDPIGAFFHGEENSATEWRNGLTEPLRKLSQQAGVVFAFSDHYNRPNEKKTGPLRLRGTPAKMQDCSSAMRLEVGEGGKAQRTLTIDRVRDGELPDLNTITLAIDLKAGTIARVGAAAGAVQAAVPTEAILTDKVVLVIRELIELGGTGESTASAWGIKTHLKSRFGCGASQAEKLVKLAVAMGKAVRTSRGHYTLPPLPGELLS